MRLRIGKKSEKNIKIKKRGNPFFYVPLLCFMSVFMSDTKWWKIDYETQPWKKRTPKQNKNNKMEYDCLATDIDAFLHNVNGFVKHIEVDIANDEKDFVTEMILNQHSTAENRVVDRGLTYRKTWIKHMKLERQVFLATSKMNWSLTTPFRGKFRESCDELMEQMEEAVAIGCMPEVYYITEVRKMKESLEVMDAIVGLGRMLNHVDPMDHQKILMWNEYWNRRGVAY